MPNITLNKQYMMNYQNIAGIRAQTNNKNGNAFDKRDDSDDEKSHSNDLNLSRS